MNAPASLPRPLRARFKPIAVIVAVFLLGGVAGGAATRAYTLDELRPSVAPGDRLHSKVRALQRDLDLSDAQVEEVTRILSSVEGDRQVLIKPCKPALNELHERTHARIHEVLNEKQRARHDELHELLEAASKGPAHSHSHTTPHP